MTSGGSRDIREIVFISSVVDKAYRSLPREVFVKVTSALSQIQNYEPVPKGEYKPLRGALNGVAEIRVSHDTNAYRVYHVIEFEDVIYVLDAGMKKSHEGSEIPKWRIETLLSRKKEAENHHRLNADALKERQGERLRRREQTMPITSKIRRP